MQIPNDTAVIKKLTTSLDSSRRLQTSHYLTVMVIIHGVLSLTNDHF